MPIRKAEAVWEGDLKNGEGTMSFGSGAFEGVYSAGARFESEPGTNPEELIAAAHAGCFSMALAHALSEAGFTPTQIQTRARVHLEKAKDGFSIPKIELETEADVPDIAADEFQRQAEDAKKNCPVSKLLQGAEITLEARLLNETTA